jgi:hypothetical protein
MKTENYLLIILSITFFSCTKHNPVPAGSERKYDCTCNTVISFVDHCGSDTLSNVITVNAYSNNEAKEKCSSNNAGASSNYTISQTSCSIE